MSTLAPALACLQAVTPPPGARGRGGGRRRVRFPRVSLRRGNLPQLCLPAPLQQVSCARSPRRVPGPCLRARQPSLTPEPPPTYLCVHACVYTHTCVHVRTCTCVWREPAEMSCPFPWAECPPNGCVGRRVRELLPNPHAHCSSPRTRETAQPHRAHHCLHAQGPSRRAAGLSGPRGCSLPGNRMDLDPRGACALTRADGSFHTFSDWRKQIKLM